MRRHRVANTGPGALDPPGGKDDNEGVISATMLAANDNGPGRRKVVLLNFRGVPVSLDEVAVIDRLMQELPLAANDNTQVL